MNNEVKSLIFIGYNKLTFSLRYCRIITGEGNDAETVPRGIVYVIAFCFAKIFQEV